MKTVAIIFGGNSSEYEVSLKSAFSIIETLEDYDYNLVKIGITKKGNWKLFKGDLKSIKENEWFLDLGNEEIIIDLSNKCFSIKGSKEVIKPDILFPVLHGGYGENGAIQGVLEMLGLPYVGCGVMASSIAMNKMVLHEFAETVDVKSTPSLVISNKGNHREEIKEFVREHGFPLYIKPNEAGSSKGISKVLTSKDLDRAINLASKYDNQILLQKEVQGVEIGCGILGNEELIFGECDQINLLNGFFDYEEKYNMVTAEILLPAKITDDKKKMIQENAKKLYLALGCKGLARIDFFLTDDGRILLNEINTMPGFTEHSRFPSMMQRKGMSYKKVIEKLLMLGMENYEQKLSKIGQ